MKKIVLILAVAGLAASCQKVSEGGNQGVLRMPEGADRYDAHEVRGGGQHEASIQGAHAGPGERKSVDVDVNGTKLKAYEGGLEQQMTTFLTAGSYDSAADDNVLKDRWYNFDNVNFKMGSVNQLEPGSDAQLRNLAAILKAYPAAKIKIGGYTDKTGDEAANKKISQGRASFIQSELAKMGVGAQVVSAEGYGSQFAKVDAAASDAERAADRKMAVRFTK